MGSHQRPVKRDEASDSEPDDAADGCQQRV
jgi:hypothetical protein